MQPYHLHNAVYNMSYFTRPPVPPDWLVMYSDACSLSLSVTRQSFKSADKLISFDVPRLAVALALAARDASRWRMHVHYIVIVFTCVRGVCVWGARALTSLSPVSQHA